MLWSAPRGRSTAFFRMMAGAIRCTSAYLRHHLPYYEALHARRLAV